MKPKRLTNTERCSTSLVIREMQIKPQDRNLHLAPIRKMMANIGEGVETEEHLFMIGGGWTGTAFLESNQSLLSHSKCMRP